MRSMIKPLAIVLVAQIVFFGILKINHNSYEPFKTDETILSFDKNKVDKLSLLTADDKFEIQKVNNQWLIPAKANFPADQNKVEQFLSQLNYVSRSIPVGSTKNTQKQLKVSEDDFEKKIELSHGDSTSTLILGSAPGFKKSYARNIGEDTIYTIDTGDWVTELNANNWIDNEYLFFNPGEISLYSSNSFDLKKDGNLYILESKDKSQLDQNAVIEFLSRTSKLNFTELIEKDPTSKASKPEFFFSVMLPKGERTYSFYNKDKENNYILKVSDSDFTFKVSGAQVDSIKNTEIETLLAKAEIAEESSAKTE